MAHSSSAAPPDLISGRIPLIDRLSNKPGDPANPSQAYREMAVRWQLPEDLLGGTLAMRAAGKLWLPAEPKEKQPEYDRRLARSILFNAFTDGIEKLVAKPMARPVQVQDAEKLPESLKGIEKDADLQGDNLTQFTRQLLKRGFSFGLDHVLIDFPVTDGKQTAQQEASGELRPYFVHVPATDLIGWRHERGADGRKRLTMIRFVERSTEADGEFGEVNRLRVRVITAPTPPKGRDGLRLLSEWHGGTKTRQRFLDEGGKLGTNQLFKRDKEDANKFIPDGEQTTHTYPGMPLEPYYVKRTGALRGEPPLEDLAWLNQSHWAKQSDHDNLARFWRVGVYFTSGLSDEEINQKIVAAGGHWVKSTNTNAKMSVVEHGGNGIEASIRDLDRTERLMDEVGLKPMLQGEVDITATGVFSGETRAQASIQSWVQSAENCLDRCYAAAARWLAVALPDGVRVNIFNEFGIGIRSEQNLKAIRELRTTGNLTRETTLKEHKRHGVFSDDFEPATEDAKVDLEQPNSAEITSTPGDEIERSAPPVAGLAP